MGNANRRKSTIRMIKIEPETTEEELAEFAPMVMLPTEPVEEPQEERLLRSFFKDSISFTVNVRVADTGAATAANYGTFWIAPFPCVLVRAYERHATLGTDGSAVTLDIEKLADGTAKGSGVSMIASTFDLKGTINTFQERTATTTLANKQLSEGQAIALKTSGTLTAVNDVVVTLVIKTDLSNLPL